MTSTAHKFNNINKQIPETQAPQSLKQNQKLKKALTFEIPTSPNAKMMN